MDEPKSSLIQPGIFAPPYVFKRDLIQLFPKDGVYFGDKIIRESESTPSEPEITILSLFCGRWHLLGHYLRNLDYLDYPKDRIHLLLFCTSPDYYFRDTLHSLKSSLKKKGYASVRVLDGDLNSTSSLTHSEKEGPVGAHLEGISSSYRQALNKVNTDLCFSIEDDEVIPSHSLKKLLLYFSDPNTACASGIAKGRHGEGFVAFDFFMDRSNGSIFGLPLERRKMLNASLVGSGGLGCTLLRMSDIRSVKIAHVLEDVPGISGCDVTLGYQLNKLGKHVIVDWDVYAYHIDSKGNIF